MSKDFGQSNPALAQYVDRVFGIDDPSLAQVQARANQAGLPEINVSAREGRMLEVLTRAAGARKAVEIGTLAGFSGIHIARGLTEDGKLFTFEYEPAHARVAQDNFKESGLSHKVQLFLGKARERLVEIEPEGLFDLVFIDADKENYPHYLTWAEDHVRLGGLVLIDNAFAWGEVLTPDQNASALAIHQTNQRLAQGGRFLAMMLPTAEGMSMGVKIR